MPCPLHHDHSILKGGGSSRDGRRRNHAQSTPASQYRSGAVRRLQKSGIGRLGHIRPCYLRGPCSSPLDHPDWVWRQQVERQAPIQAVSFHLDTHLQRRGCRRHRYHSARTPPFCVSLRQPVALPLLTCKAVCGSGLGKAEGRGGACIGPHSRRTGRLLAVALGLPAGQFPCAPLHSTLAAALPWCPFN